MGIIQEFIKMSKKFADIEDVTCFNKRIAKGQKNSPQEAQKEYSLLFEPYRKKAFSIGLDPVGKVVDTPKFATYLQATPIHFFIGGAYGLEREFLSKCDEVISLSPLTFSHKIAKVILFEQLFRGYCILNQHPYHK